jgi:hypothetical protein
MSLEQRPTLRDGADSRQCRLHGATYSRALNTEASSAMVPAPMSDAAFIFCTHAPMLRAMGIQVTGRLHAIFDAKQITERFAKREFVLELADNPKYPQFVLFELTGERIGMLESFKPGDDVRVEFTLRGREWTGRGGEVKYFNSLDVWTIEAQGESASGGSTPPDHDDRSVLDDDVPF